MCPEGEYATNTRGKGITIRDDTLLAIFPSFTFHPPFFKRINVYSFAKERCIMRYLDIASRCTEFVEI